MSQTIQCSSLEATLQGKLVTRKINDMDESILQYRGIKFGIIPKRFAKALPKDDWDGQVLDCTKFGPRCPQNPVDIEQFLRVPSEEGERENEDEFECLNLVVTLPSHRPISGGGRLLPVLIWIHGGSQVVTFGSPATKCGDPFKLVVDSARLQMPMVVVSLNYRLNIFAFGNGKEVNLGLSDQQLGIEWVKRHIGDFGGDRDNITLFGQSAGAVYAHANMFTIQGLKRGILSSGSLYLSPPLPRETGRNYINNVAQKVRNKCGSSLENAPVEVLLNSLRELNVNTQWIQEEKSLENWRNRMERVNTLLIGDVEYESVLWRNGIENLPPAIINTIFNNNIPPSACSKIKQIYGISPNRPTSSKIGALDFLNDARYALPVSNLVSKWKTAGKPVYRYLFDQVNPWQASSRAHHAVDLIYLFGGYDEHIHQFQAGVVKLPALYQNVGQEMRKSWIRFVNGEEPWKEDQEAFAFGPHGDCKIVREDEVAVRRRVAHCQALGELEDLDSMVSALATGMLSFLN